jgi:acetyl esterase/lipase
MVVPWNTSGNRMARNVVKPSVTVFTPPKGKANGTAIVIAPGGAFHFLMMDHEGYDMARWIAGLGVTAFVLKYRLARTPDKDEDMEAFRTELQSKLGRAKPGDTDPPGRTQMEDARGWAEEDGRQAIRFVRENAAQWGIDPRRIGITGFSAGGGVCMGPTFTHDGMSRPDFSAPVYPAYRAGVPVPDDAPPLFILISDDDMSIPPVSSARLYEAWHKAGKPAELHIFGNGAHGFGMNLEGILPAPWPELFRNWLASHGFLPKPAA